MPVFIDHPKRLPPIGFWQY